MQMPITGRRHAGIFGKGTGEVFIVLIAAFQCDLRSGKGGFEQKLLGIFHAAHEDIIGAGNAEPRLIEPLKVRNGDAEGFRNFLDAPVFTGIFVDLAPDGFEIAVIIVMFPFGLRAGNILQIQ